MRPSLGSRCCCAERHAQCCWPTAVALSSHCVPLQTQCAFQTTPFATQMAKTRSTCGSGRTAFMYRAVGNDNEQQATMSETTYQKMEHVSTPKLQTCPVMVPKLIYVLTLIVPQHGTSSTPVRVAAGHRPALPFPPLPEELLSPHPPSSLCYHVTQGDIL